MKRTTKIFVSDLLINMSIGVFGFEKKRQQNVLLNMEALIEIDSKHLSDDIENTVSYDFLIKTARAEAAKPHINLVETYTGSIIEKCMEDKRILEIKVHAQKLDMYKKSAKSVGVEMSARR